MELLVATWTVRLTLVSALAVAWISMSVGSSLIDAVTRAALAAFVFTFIGRQLIGWLETPQQRMLRLRARRNARRAKTAQGAPAGASQATGGRPPSRAAGSPARRTA